MLLTFSMAAHPVLVSRARCSTSAKRPVMRRTTGTGRNRNGPGSASHRSAALHAAPRPGNEYAYSSSQIDFDHALVRRHLVDGAFGEHGAFVQAGDFHAKLANERHVVLNHHHGLVLVDFLEQFGGLLGFDV